MQRAYNYALAPMTSRRVHRVGHRGSARYARVLHLRRGVERAASGRRSRKRSARAQPLTLDQVLTLRAGGAQYSTLEPASVRGRAPPGKRQCRARRELRNLGGDDPRPREADRADRRAGARLEAATRLGRIAFDTVAGYLAGGMGWLDREARARWPGWSGLQRRSLVEQLATPAPPLLIDVRAPGEWEAGADRRIGRRPTFSLPERLETLPRERAIVVHCASGYRSAIAAGLLRRDGFPQVADLVGGMAAWVFRSDRLG